MVGLGKVAQHIVYDQIFAAGMADANAHADIVVADMVGQRFEPVMAGNAAARLHPHFAGHKVELVVEDDHVFELELVEPDRLADRSAGLVHIGGRLEQQHRLAGEPAFSGEALEALAPGGKVVERGDGVHRHEADIVAVQGVVRPRIAEADEKLHVAP